MGMAFAVDTRRRKRALVKRSRPVFRSGSNPDQFASSTERIFPAWSLNQAIVGPFPRMIPFSLAEP
jgi:hypothetical protein